MKTEMSRELMWRLSITMLGVFLIVCVAPNGLAASSDAGISAPRYATPEDAPGFAKPQFISKPLMKAYPGIEYNIRPAIKGGTFPYMFTLAKSPTGMKIHPLKGTITWTPPKSVGKTYPVKIVLKDSAGRPAEQSFIITVTKKLFFFVSPKGDDKASGSIDKPWKTIRRMTEPPENFTYPQGAMVYLRGGDYRVSIPDRGKKGTNINTVRVTERSPHYWLAYPGEKPVIDLGWSGEKQKAAHLKILAAGTAKGNKKKPQPATNRGYGHRFVMGGGSSYLYIDGLEVKNACYYMFVMWGGRNTIHFRRSNFHHLWADWAENPGFIFTFAGNRRGGKTWGVRAKVKAYENFVIQDNIFRDRFMIGHHGGAFVFYTVHNAVVENNLFERMGGTAFIDKDNGYGNTYRGNVIREPNGEVVVISQGSCDEIEISHNIIESNLKLTAHAGWGRNFWVHHNTFKGAVTFPWLTRRGPSKIDATKGDYSSHKTKDSQKLVRESPLAKRFVHIYRNVFSEVPAGKTNRNHKNVITIIPRGAGFAQDWRFIRWENNLVHRDAKVFQFVNTTFDFSELKAAGVDANGVRAKFKLDKNGDLPKSSKYFGQYGRDKSLIGVPLQSQK